MNFQKPGCKNKASKKPVNGYRFFIIGGSGGMCQRQEMNKAPEATLPGLCYTAKITCLSFFVKDQTS